MAISAIVVIGIPIVLFRAFRKRCAMSVVPMLVGAAAFVVFALGLENIVHLQVLPKYDLVHKPLLYVVYGCLMAGIFEETARFISFHLLKKKYKGIGTGLSYGIGHGGVEAILLAGVSMIAAIVLSLMVNSGTIGIIIDKLQGSALEAMNTQLTTLAETASPLFLVSGLERIFAVSVQISLSVMVFYAVYSVGLRWMYPAAIVLHAVIDVPAAMMQAHVISSVALVECIVGVEAVLVALLAVWIHKKKKHTLNLNKEIPCLNLTT
ncbi:MAG: YhfC family intramembrane metalloprotease [Prevotellaceae bacterium]|jgi:uncharacterized membrane protein YhfC|nr:YhfC family intramembrane metalloprotease [Prevotellaceae bacterium]